MRRVIFWFRNDLRVEDNEGLVKAAAENEEILPVYILERSWLKEKQFGIDRLGSFRLKFLLESLCELKNHLKALGSDLLIVVGDPVTELQAIAKKHSCTKVYSQAACAYNEVATETLLAKQIPCDFSWGETLYHLEDLDFSLSELPDVFTHFRKAVEKISMVRKCIETPLHLSSPSSFGSDIPSMESLGYSVPEPDARAVLNFTGGATKAMERIEYYLWNKELLSTYKNTRNGLIGGDYSSKLSPWLANGCISPRQVYWQVRKYEKYIKKNSSTYWLVFELLWRDYFHFVAKKYGKRLFQKTGLISDEPTDQSSGKFSYTWAKGETSEPFVNANIRELNSTGFMSNRGRQIVASYFVHTLNKDWRLGAAYFEKMLIDYDPCSNYSNWAYIAGVGNDPRGGRAFNVLKQTEAYDPKGSYQKLWLD